MPCPGTPPILWSRTFSDEVDFRGASDGNGNLYWIEYDPPPTFANPDAPAWLVSADANGEDRYRVPAPAASEEGEFLLASGMVVMSKDGVLAAHDAATGALSWTIDLDTTSPGATPSSIADLGNGELAFAFYSFTGAGASGLEIVDAATGALVWSNLQSTAANYTVQGSDGAGSLLGTAFPTDTATPSFSTTVDVFAMDASGQQAWDARITNFGSLLAWPSGAPWLGIGGAQGTSAADNYLAMPSIWFAATTGSDLGFVLDYGGTVAATPVSVHAIRGGAVVADGTLPGTTIYDGVSAWPFLAGDHLLLVAQSWHSIPALCHPLAAGAAAISRIDTSTSYQCPLTFEGESGIVGAALLPGRLIIGRRTYLTDACTHDVQPVTIEAYSVPNESLATSGWVQSGGSPGLGNRPLRPWP